MADRRSAKRQSLVRSLFLWVHALSASIWVLAAACTALAAVALGAEGEELGEFAIRVVPKLNWISTVFAALLFATGIGNLVMVGRARDFNFSPTFVRVLAAKVTLFVLMVSSLAASWRAQGMLIAKQSSGAPAAVYLRRIILLAAAIALMGAMALALGLWLVGS